MQKQKKYFFLNYLALFLYFITVFVAISFHEPWRDEWQAFWIATQNKHFLDLVNALRFEVHPPLWYLLIQAIDFFSLSPELSLKLTSLIVVLFFGVTAFRLSFDMGLFSLWILFNYYFLYEYSVLSRGYLIGITFLLIAAKHLSTFDNSRKSNILISFSLILACWSELLSGVIAFGLGIYWIYLKTILPKNKLNVQNTLTYLLTIVFSALPFFLVRPSKEMVFFSESPLLFWNFEKLFKVISLWAAGLIPVPNPSTTQVWNSNLFSNQSLAVIAFLGIILFANKIRHHKPALCFFIFSNLTLMVLFYTKYLGYKRHHGYFTVAMIVTLILLPREALAKIWKSRTAKLIALAGVLSGLYLVVIDIKRPFSAGFLASQYIEKHYDPKDPTITYMAESDYLGTSVVSYFGLPVFDQKRESSIYYVKWDKNRNKTFSTDYRDLVKKSRPNTKTIIFISYPTSSEMKCSGCQLIDSQVFSGAMSDEDIQLSIINI